jgi:hypothetical protein
MMALGVGVGFAGLWLDGWVPHLPSGDNAAGFLPVSFVAGPFFRHGDAPNLAGELSYFALAFFALRWWKLADRRRSHRFSLAPILAAGFWGLVLMILWQDFWLGPLVLATAAGVIQLVSPWEPPPPPVARRMRLRYA